MKVLGSQHWNRARRVLVLVPFVLACFGPLDPAEIVLLDGTFEPPAAAPITVGGTVAMVIGADRTQIGVGFSGGNAGATFGWSVRNGTCGSTGSRIGPADLFVGVVLGAEGSARAETIVNRRIDPGQRYAAEIFERPDGSGRVVACAELNRRN
jgi:hypothetical protein